MALTRSESLPATRPASGIGAVGSGPTILGERPVTIPTGGKIRAGIKVLTSAAKQNPAAQEIYDKGVAAGASWDAIDKRIREATGMQKSPLTPRNVPYFTVRRSDFTMPEMADAIMERYAEDRGEGRHLYRFPVIFPVDSWQAILPHKLRTYGRSGLKYWSEYGPDGTRHCMTHGEVEINPKNKRAIRPFGGRPVIPRPDNGGLCNPEKCPQYQARQCNLSGSLLFYVPGVPGTAAISLPTTSFYSMQQARQKMEMVAFVTGGKIAGTFNGKPIFWVTKRQSEVSMLDPKTGEPKRVKQWLIELEADIDMEKLFQAQEQPALKQRGAEAATLLGGDEAQSEALEASENAEFALPETGAEPEPETSPPPPVTDAPSPAEAAPDGTDHAPDVPALRKHLYAATKSAGIPVEKFGAWAMEEYGADWGTDADSLLAAIDIVEMTKTDSGLRAQITGEASSEDAGADDCPF
jgi:hypothetical protein